MPSEIKNDFDNFIRQQIDTGSPELFMPVSTRKVKSKKMKGLAIDKFAECESLEQLDLTINTCQKCVLGRTRTKFVFGTGNPDADIMFIGEAPGGDEDMQGIPFVGRAGKLLDKMLIEVGVRRADVYIANILKCRPPNNRDPLPDEIDACEPYLHMQIKLIKPKVICSLGRIAAQTLLKTNMTLGAMRGRWFDYRGIKFMVTYHPAAILRSQSYLPAALDDLRKLISEAGK